MAVTPQTDLLLIKSPLELDNLNQIKFASASAQSTYFANLPHKRVTDFSYQRKDNIIRYPEHIDNLIEYNYVMYKNNHYSSKYFYAFIERMEYVNDNMTNIYIKTDVYQTWQFNLDFKKSFVEREHVNNDSVGLHTVPENVETGEYISTKLQPTLSDNLETCFCIAVSDLKFNVYTTLNELLPSGLYYIGLTSLQGVRDVCKMYDDDASGDAINSVFVIPKTFFSDWQAVSGIDGQVSTKVKFDTGVIEMTVNKTNYLGNEYVPVNKKLLTFPYSFLQVSNHSGIVVNYRWEYFNMLLNQNTIQFNLRGALSPGGSFSAYPVDYKNILNNFDESITLGKFPIGGWNTDVYTNWLTQNGVNIPLQIAGSAVATIAGAFTGNAVGVASGVLGVANTIGSVYEHSLIPDQARGNTNVGDYNFTFNLINLEFKRMSINNEYSKIIDDYFSMYGYKVNSLKVPNLTGRRNWNFVKLINANIEGSIPQEDMQEIKEMFNNGVTIWHNTNTFLDYSQNNDII